MNARAFANSVNASPNATPSIVIGGKMGIVTTATAPPFTGIGVDTVVAKVNGAYPGPSLVTVRIHVWTGGGIAVSTFLFCSRSTERRSEEQGLFQGRTSAGNARFANVHDSPVLYGFTGV